MFFNTLKTVLLLCIMSLLLITIGSFFGFIGMQIACIMACVMNGFLYFFSDNIVLRCYNAYPLDTQVYAYIHDTIAHLAHTMNIPKPKVWLIDSAAANAFATGRNPTHASIALTTGIIELLDLDELQGVLAHELSHIKNRDIMISTIAATIATAVGYGAYMLRHAALWGSYNRRKNEGNPFLLFIAGIILPFIATLVQLAISRSREYQADDTGARTTRDPLALASALKKLAFHSRYATSQADYAPASSLGIIHAVSGQKWADIVSTHPSTEKRIERLEKLHQKL